MSAPAQLSADAATTDRAVGPSRPAGDFSVLALQDVAAMEEYIPSWDDLAAGAIEPNVFYESWMLLPALRAYGAGSVTVVLVFANHAPRRHGKPLLCGLFPLTAERRCLVRVLCLWQYIHCYLGVPLIRAGFGPGVLDAFFHWLAEDSAGAPLLECGRITGDGPFYHLLLGELREQRRQMFLSDAYTRALLRHDVGPVRNALSGDKRKKLRKAEDRLKAKAPIAYSTLAEDGDLDSWLADFLRLEASGWKGQTGTALACRDTDRQFFLDVARGAFQRKRLMMLGLSADGKPIAQLCNFLAGEGSFAFKVAFDEAFASFSPGALLELENLRQVEATPELRWMDSCTDAGASMVNHLWADRRVIQTLLIETGRAPGALVLAVLPMWRWLRGVLRHGGVS